MRKCFLLLAACALMATSCDNTTKNEDTTKDLKPFSINTITFNDSVQFPPEAMEEWMTDDIARYTADIDDPVTENEALRNNITSWICGFLNEEYKGNPQDVKAMVEFTKNEMFGPETGTPENYVDHSAKLMENNDRFVTYSGSSWRYNGGAYGVTIAEGATFSKATGNRFSFKMFKNPESLREMLKVAMQKQFFDPLLKDDDLTFEEAVYPEVLEKFPLPKTEPWIFHDSIFFTYEDSEIATHAFGLPGCGFSYMDLKNELTDEGKAFFNK